jgi:uncharacterized membrane protein
MTLSETGESRVRGYLYVLDRSLRASVSAALAADAVREVESHIRERVAESSGMPNERDALETILAPLGSPSTVARAYSLEVTMEEAAISGRISAVIRSLFQAAATGVAAFCMALALFVGYAIGVGFLMVGILKPIFPNNVGLWFKDGFPILGAQFPAPTGGAPMGGYWLIPICFGVGLAILTATHVSARRWLGNLRERLSERRARRSVRRP